MKWRIRFNHPTLGELAGPWAEMNDEECQAAEAMLAKAAGGELVYIQMKTASGDIVFVPKNVTLAGILTFEPEEIENAK